MTLEALFIVVVVSLLIVVLVPKQLPWRRRLKIRNAKRIHKKILALGSEHPGKAIQYLRKIDAYTFEELAIIALNKHGYNAYKDRGYSHDGGIDGKLLENGDLWIIQCKRYKGTVSNQVLQELVNAKDRFRASGGLLIHTGKSTKRLHSDGKKYKIYVVSGSRLLKLINSPGRDIKDPVPINRFFE